MKELGLSKNKDTKYLCHGYSYFALSPIAIIAYV